VNVKQNLLHYMIKKLLISISHQNWSTKSVRTCLYTNTKIRDLSSVKIRCIYHLQLVIRAWDYTYGALIFSCQTPMEITWKN